jgi:hypothetical protein
MWVYYCSSLGKFTVEPHLQVKLSTEQTMCSILERVLKVRRPSLLHSYSLLLSVFYFSSKFPLMALGRRRARDQIDSLRCLPAAAACQPSDMSRTGARTGVHTILETLNTALLINLVLNLSHNCDASKDCPLKLVFWRQLSWVCIYIPIVIWRLNAGSI